MSGNCESLLSGKSGWSGAFGATFNLPVASAMATFELEIETDLPLSKITFWDADVTPTSGNTFIATNKSWFGGKQAGETLSLGFQVLFLVEFFYSPPSNLLSSRFNSAATLSQPSPQSN